MKVEEVTALAEAEGLARDLGVEFVELDPERVAARIPVDTRHVQPMGFLHGGVSVALAETVATVGGWLNCPEGKGAFGQEINASHLRPKRGGALTAVATPVHRGRSSQVWQVSITDEEGRPVCASRCTLAVVDLVKDPGKPRVKEAE